MAKASGSMIRAIARVSLTGINRPDRSSTKPPPEKPVKHVILFVAAVIRAVRIYHEAAEIVEASTAGAPAGIVEALTAGVVAGNPPRSGEGVTALLVEVSGAVKRGNRAAGVAQAAGACPQAVVREAEDPAVAGLVAVVAAAAAAAVEADGKDWVKMSSIINYEFDGGERNAY